MTTEYTLSVESDIIDLDLVKQAESNQELELDWGNVIQHDDSCLIRCLGLPGDIDSEVWLNFVNQQLTSVILHPNKNLEHIEDWLNNNGCWFDGLPD